MIKKLTDKEVVRLSNFRRDGKKQNNGVYQQTQKLASEALQFGFDIRSDGYNIFALGEPGLGKHELIIALAKEKSLNKATPDDYVYVYNFKDPDKPIYLKFPPGKGLAFANDMRELIDHLRKDIPKIFESKEYENEKAQLIERFQEFDRQVFESLAEEARGRGFVLERGVDGFVFLPVKDGEVIDDEKFSKLNDLEKKAIQEKIKVLQQRLKESIKLVKEAEKETRRKLSELEKRIASSAVVYHIDDLKEKYNFNEKIIDYLNNVQEDVLNNLEDFKQSELPVPSNIALRFFKPEPSFIRYQVNVFIDRTEQSGAPVVYETNPTHSNLIGKVEYRFQMGMAVTDFTLIKPGALHKANGGYLILDALDVLRTPFSYDVLKRAIKNKEVKIEDPLEAYHMASSTLKPEPIPIDVKVILIGSPLIYYILYNYDEDFSKIFKVKADFDRDMDWDEEGEKSYAFFIDQLVEKEKLLPFDESAIQRVIEFGGRLVSDQKKLSMKVEEIASLVREANYVSKKMNKTKVEREDVRKAIELRKLRHNKIERRVHEAIMRDIYLISTEGMRVGTINGLSVYDLGDYSFGRPSRITARVSAGKEGVVHLDREAKLSGKIHDKGSMVITAYLNSKFGSKTPLSFNATLCFEQLYEMVEGDSASVAEVLVLQSALGNLPLKQNLAVTGSLNQHGEVQPIGGVNEKIEGFFAVCKERGLDGSHGVVIPKSNLQHLMLDEEVIEAISKGLFHIYAIETAEEALEIFTGLPAGTPNEKGEYEEGTANYYIMKNLMEMKKAMESKKEQQKKGTSKKDEKEGE